MKNLFKTLLLSTLLLFSSTSAFAYSDTSNHWAKNSIDFIKNKGIINQFNDSNLYPDRPMTRAECAELIADFIQKRFNAVLPDGNIDKFSDLNNDRRSQKIRSLSRYRYISLMDPKSHIYGAECKIINGYPDGLFRPNNNLTRAEFAKMFYSALDCMGYVPACNSLRFASDSNLHWADFYINLLYGFRIMNGYNQIQGSDFTFKYYDFNGEISTDIVNLYIEMRPDNLVTRAEAIQMVKNSYDADNLNYIGLGDSTSRPSGEENLYYID